MLFENILTKNLHRLVVTEMGHAAEQATLKFYKDSKIDQYQYLATLESHTCDVCAHLDGKIFNFKDKKEGMNYPLIHPYCRCTTVPYDESLPDIQSRWSRDPVTGKGKWTEGSMTFKQWKQAQNVKETWKRVKIPAINEENKYLTAIPVFKEARSIPTKGKNIV